MGEDLGGRPSLGGGPAAASRQQRAVAARRGVRGCQATHPVGGGHLHHDFRGRPAEVPAVAAHYHGAALAITQVDGR